MLDRPNKESYEKAAQERFENVVKSKRFFDRIDTHENKVCRDLERAAARKDKREVGGWLKAWADDDKKELRRWEREMSRD